LDAIASKEANIAAAGWGVRIPAWWAAWNGTTCSAPSPPTVSGSSSAVTAAVVPAPAAAAAAAIAPPVRNDRRPNRPVWDLAVIRRS
jgi:hypothetical protein